MKLQEVDYDPFATDATTSLQEVDYNPFEDEEQEELSTLSKVGKVGKRMAQSARASVGGIAQGYAAQIKKHDIPTKLSIKQQRELNERFAQSDTKDEETFFKIKKEIQDRDKAKRIEGMEQWAEDNSKVDPKVFKGGVGGFIEDMGVGLASYAGPMAVSAVNLPAGFAATLAQAKGQKYAEYKKQGKSEDVAQKASDIHALTSGSAEFAGNLLQLRAIKTPFKSVLKKTPLSSWGQKFAMRLAESGIGEGGEEGIQGVTELAADIYADHPDISADELADRAIEIFKTPEFQKDWRHGMAVGFASGIALPGAAGMASMPIHYKNYTNSRNLLLDESDAEVDKKFEDIDKKYPDKKPSGGLFSSFSEEEENDIKDENDLEMSDELKESLAKPANAGIGVTDSTSMNAGMTKEQASKQVGIIQDAMAQREAERAEREKENDEKALRYQQAAKEAAEKERQKQADAEIAAKKKEADEFRQFISDISTSKGLYETTSKILPQLEESDNPHAKSLGQAIRNVHKALATKGNSSEALRGLKYELEEAAKLPESGSNTSKMSALLDHIEYTLDNAITKASIDESASGREEGASRHPANQAEQDRQQELKKPSVAKTIGKAKEKVAEKSTKVQPKKEQPTRVVDKTLNQLPSNRAAQDFKTKVKEKKPKFEPVKKKVENLSKIEVTEHKSSFDKGYKGYDVVQEKMAGANREGKDKDGKAWSKKLENDYGYIKKTGSEKGDQVDVFFGPNKKSDKVFVVNQTDPSTGKFDEHKVMMGFDSQQQARKAYLSNYPKNWNGVGDIVPMSSEEFKTWLDNSSQKREAERITHEGVKLPPAKTLKKTIVKAKAIRESDGKIVEINDNAYDALNENKAKLDILEELKGCII